MAAMTIKRGDPAWCEFFDGLLNAVRVVRINGTSALVRFGIPDYRSATLFADPHLAARGVVPMRVRRARKRRGLTAGNFAVLSIPNDPRDPEILLRVPRAMLTPVSKLYPLYIVPKSQV